MQLETASLDSSAEHRWTRYCEPWIRFVPVKFDRPGCCMALKVKLFLCEIFHVLSQHWSDGVYGFAFDLEHLVVVQETLLLGVGFEIAHEYEPRHAFLS